MEHMDSNVMKHVATVLMAHSVTSFPETVLPVTQAMKATCAERVLQLQFYLNHCWCSKYSNFIK